MKVFFRSLSIVLSLFLFFFLSTNIFIVQFGGGTEIMSTFTPNLFGVDPLNITGEHPVNNSVIHYFSPVLFFTVSSSTYLKMNYTVFWGLNVSNVTNVLAVGVNVDNGVMFHDFSNASNYTSYFWSVNLTDSVGNWYNESYVFSISPEVKGAASSYNMGIVMAMGGSFLIFGMFMGVLILKKRKENKNNGFYGGGRY